MQPLFFFPPSLQALGRCKNCVYVVERIKQGYHYLLPNICEEILAKTQNNEEYATVSGGRKEARRGKRARTCKMEGSAPLP